MEEEEEEEKGRPWLLEEQILYFLCGFFVCFTTRKAVETELESVIRSGKPQCHRAGELVQVEGEEVGVFMDGEGAVKHRNRAAGRV